MEVRPKALKIYRTARGELPFLTWLGSLRDERTKAIVKTRLVRVRLSNMGHTRSVGDGVQELKIDYGPGYRIYFGHISSEIVILLCGGDKKTQDEDIKTAKTYWQIYKKEQSHANY